MRNLALFIILLCSQSCIVFHNYHKITTYNQAVNASKMKLDGYFVAKVASHFTITRVDTYYQCKTFYYDGTLYYLGGYQDTTISLVEPFTYIQNHRNDSSDEFNIGYTWGRYCIQNDTLVEQSFYHTGVPFVFMWKVEEKRYKVINSKTLQGIDILKDGKRTPLDENYHFMENTNYKPSSYNFINKYLNKYGTKNRYAFFPWIQLWPWW